MWNRLRTWTVRLETGVLSPVAVREMRSLMRGNRAPGALLACTGLAVAGGLALLQWQFREGALTVEQMAVVGCTLHGGIVLLEAALALLLMPMLTAGLLAREYEQRSVDDLILTRLTGMEIAWGKLAAGLCFAAVAVVCMLPVLAVAFVLGGVSPAELIGGQLLVLGLAAYVGAAAISYAAHYRHPVAILLSTWFLTPFVMLFLLPFQAAIFLTVVLATLGLDRIKTDNSLGRRPLEILYGVFVMMPAMVLGPILAITSMFALNPPVVLAVLLLHGENGPDLFEWLNAIWWLLPLLSAAMLAFGAHTMLEDAAAAIRKTEGAA